MKENLDYNNMPKHVAVIMDGNGRWAQERNLPRSQGHIEGVRRVQDMLDISRELGIKALTLFTFSTENWQRPEKEVTLIMQILAKSLQKKLPKLKKDNIHFQVIGKMDQVPDILMRSFNQVIEETAENDGLIMNLAFNYGGRQEIIDAVKKISLKVKSGQLEIEDINDNVISQSLYTYDLPDPDFLIRTSGEKRISNFLLWQLSYAEFIFVDKFWPEFTPDEFIKCIVEYQNRDRRFGNLGEKISL